MNSDYFKNFSYSKLNHLQVGRICEYWVKMFLTLENLDTYSNEVDDKGIDFIVRLDNSMHIDIQVKSVRLKTSAYVFITKKTWPTEFLQRNNLYLALVLLKDNFAPDVYLIPASAWLRPNDVLCSRDYGAEGQTSLPEWGINVSTKNLHLLQQYALPLQVAQIKKQSSGFE